MSLCAPSIALNPWFRPGREPAHVRGTDKCRNIIYVVIPLSLGQMFRLNAIRLVSRNHPFTTPQELLQQWYLLPYIQPT